MNGPWRCRARCEEDLVGKAWTYVYVQILRWSGRWRLDSDPTVLLNKVRKGTENTVKPGAFSFCINRKTHRGFL